MTRTLARRLATAAGSLGLALACAGTAAAATGPATPVKAAVAVTTDTAPHYGLLSDVIIDVVTIVGHLLGDLL